MSADDPAVPTGKPIGPERLVPTPLRVGSEVAARLLVIAAALALLIFLVIQLRIVVIPVAIACLLAALLGPLVQWLVKRRVPRGVATVLVLVGGLALLGALLSFVVSAFVAGLPELQTQLTASLDTIRELLRGPPFNIGAETLDDIPGAIGAAVAANRDALTSGALTTAATVTEVVAGILLALFTLIFFLYDGARIWRFLLLATPRARRDRVDTAGRRAFAALVGYTRATVLVAAVDAIGIGVGLWIVGVPLVVPLAALVFLGAFIPTVGAIVSGSVAVLIALVANGIVPALVVLAILVGIQQLEGHVLQPLLLGRAVRLHALAVVLAVAAGVVVSGITGALLAVPLLAVVSAGLRSLVSEGDPKPELVDAFDPRQALPSAAAPPRPVWGPRLVRIFRRLTGRGATEEA